MKLIVVFLLILSSVNLALTQENIPFNGGLHEYMEASVSNDYYLTGENFTNIGLGFMYKPYPLSKVEISVMKTVMSYPNKPFLKPKVSFDLASISAVGDFINLKAKIININTNSSIFESQYIEWIKVGLGIGAGGYFSDNQIINKAGGFTGWRFNEMTDNTDKFLSMYFLVNIGYSSFKIDTSYVKPIKSKMFLYDFSSSFDADFNLGLLCRISKNTLIFSELTFCSLKKYDYQYDFLKIKGGLDFLIFYNQKTSYLTLSINYFYDSFHLVRGSFFSFKEGINCGLNYNF